MNFQITTTSQTSKIQPVDGDEHYKELKGTEFEEKHVVTSGLKAVFHNSVV